MVTGTDFILSDTVDMPPCRFSPDADWAAGVVAESIVRVRNMRDDMQKTLVPLRDRQYLAINPNGDCQGSLRCERLFVYVVQTENGQETLMPEEFREQYLWPNDREKAKIKLD